MQLSYQIITVLVKVNVQLLYLVKVDGNNTVPGQGKWKHYLVMGKCKQLHYLVKVKANNYYTWSW